MRAISLFFLVLTVAMAPARSRAQGPEAERLFREGVALREAGDSGAAIERLEAAQRLEPTPRTAYNLAAALADAGRHAAARDLLTRLLATDGDDLLITGAATELLATVSAEVATLTVEIEGLARGERLSIDGEAELAGRGALALDPGRHRVELRDAQGTVLARREISLERGEARAIVLRPVRAAAAAAAAPAPSRPGIASPIAPPAQPDGADERLWIGLAIGGGALAAVLLAIVIGVAVGAPAPAPIEGDVAPVRVGGGR